MSILRVAYSSEETIGVLVETTGDPSEIACEFTLVKSHVDLDAVDENDTSTVIWTPGYWETDTDGWWATVDFADFGATTRGWYLIYLRWTVSESLQPKQCAGSLEVY